MDEHAGHDKHAGHSVEMFRDRFWLSLALTIPALVWEPMLQDWFGYTAPRFPGSQYIPAIFGAAVFLYGGWVFLKGAWGELKNRLPGMMTLISLAILVAFLYSAAVTLGYPGHALWWELATLVTIMLLGHWIEMRSIFQAQGALKELAKLLPDTALRIVHGDEVEVVRVGELHDGDLLLIRPGAGIPADGLVRSGKSSVNEAMITGESRPIEKREGDKVIAGTVNAQGSLRIEVTGTGDSTALAGIMRLVAQAQTSRSRAQALADRAAFWLTLVAIGAAVVTFIAWQVAGATLDFTITRVVTVLVIACPHALGLAVPLVIAISTTVGAQNGLLVRDRRGLEEARKLDIVVFDKTGTLTLGSHRVVSMTVADGVTGDDALRVAAAAQRDAEHPIAHALTTSAKERGLEIPASSGFESMPGVGIRAEVEGRTLHLGGPGMLRRLGVEPSEKIQQAARTAAANAQSATWLIEGERVLAVFAIADAVRPESHEAVARLHAAGIRVAMLTGDSQAVAESVARELGIDRVFAEVLPEDKVAKIEELQRDGSKVAMVGDGVNDAPALAQADLGLAMGTGTDVAIEAADITLVRGDLRAAADALRLARRTLRTIKMNLFWAFAYNAAAIPLAAFGLLNPMLAGAAMALSSVFVVSNSLRLRSFKARTDDTTPAPASSGPVREPAHA